MEDAAFLKAIESQPDDDTVKLVYADWLDERGDCRGEFIRLEHLWRTLPARLLELEEQIDSLWLRAVSTRRLKKTNGFPTADWLWDVMAAAQQDRDNFRALLETMPEDRLRDIYGEIWNAAFEVYPDHYEEERGIQRDDFQDIGEWVVAQGREMYEAVWANPKLLPHPHTIVRLGFLQLASDVCYERLGRWPERW